MAEGIGFILGIITNLALQVIIMRYLFVYYLYGGDKTKYIEHKWWFITIFILIGLIIYNMVLRVSPVVAILFTLALTYFAIVLYRKWKKNEIIPSPLSKNTKKNEAKDIKGQEN